MAGALIVTVEIGSSDLAWLDGLRKAHYPPERNRVPAHLTMFHALPPSAEWEVRRALSRVAAERPPSASIDGLMNLGGGVAFRVVSPELDEVRRELVRDFHGLLSAADEGGWRPHVTIQNKVPPKNARALLARLESEFRTRPLSIAGLGLHRYLDGPWEKIAVYAFRGAS
jgi:hypothetical protein